MSRSLLPWLIVACTSGSMLGCDRLVGPRSYDDCILANVQGVTNNAALVEVRASCRDKFPEKAAPPIATRDLAPWELAALTGRAGQPLLTHTFSGNLYNGNKAVTVTELQISVTTSENGKDVTRPYSAQVVVPPLTAKDFAFDIIVGDKGTTSGWVIGSARGY